MELSPDIQQLERLHPRLTRLEVLKKIEERRSLYLKRQRKIVSVIRESHGDLERRRLDLEFDLADVRHYSERDQAKLWEIEALQLLTTTDTKGALDEADRTLRAQETVMAQLTALIQYETQFPRPPPVFDPETVERVNDIYSDS